MDLLQKLRGVRGTSNTAAMPLSPELKPAPPLQVRHSSGLLELTRALGTREDIALLDLGVTSPTNISYFTGLGYKVYSEDVLGASAASDLQVPNEEGVTAADPDRLLAQSLTYPDATFDAVLCWDIADFMEESLVRPVVQRLWAALKPGGVMLALFHSREAGSETVCCRYHLAGSDSLEVRPLSTAHKRPSFSLQRSFHNRHIENLFRDFNSVKFFLARDHLREVLVVK